MGLLAAAPLSMGLLTHNAIAEWHPALGSKLEQACQSAADICTAHGVNIATLAILFAMSHPNIPCTILGMKDIQQVDSAAILARRFGMVDWSTPGLCQEDILKQILSETEITVFKLLNDQENGPFAGLDTHDTSVIVPLYQWDGVKEAHKFWKAINGAQYEPWQWN